MISWKLILTIFLFLVFEIYLIILVKRFDNTFLAYFTFVSGTIMFFLIGFMPHIYPSQ